ncbi:BCCT family transporter [Nocardiopsis sp. NRRL B-16309]|uniref:BCCT family transporter n=1 Tax=Nocardiopsis sp. NRRL B-16309 TaxID=1519494 RepID=UPI0006AFBC03|nr:BCCT family transporter [Nocardiopsis sp. NRRL B-16309]KOX13316.1 choline transporter [Nocardiopsis sp. NRRL B-16309]
MITAPRVFWPSVILVTAFVAAAVFFTEAVSAAVTALQDTVIGTFGWYYILIVCAFVVFSIRVGLGRFGDIKLGPDDEEPEFRLSTWFSMLFAAGMGIGLVFWGVAEPLNHFAAPKPGVEGTPHDLAQQSLVQTFLHWGLHPWAIYVVVGLAIAYAIHRRNRPVSIRWALEPVLGKERVNGWAGDLIDIIAVVGTLFGVATSLGLGVLQIASGLDFLGVVSDPGNWTYIVLIGAITALAIFSVTTGVKRGIKWLSQINMGLAAVLLLIVLVTGPTLFIFREFVQSLGLYFQNLLRLSFDTSALEGADGAQWQGWWTTFYWGWWMSWAPFVGVFIARISRGRTVREFVTGVLLVPTAVTFLWLTVFGGSALYREVFGSGGGVAADGSVDTEAALFSLLGDLPGGTLLVAGGVVLIVLFFVTSSDSGSLVVDMLASGGDPETPVWSRVFWATAEGLVAIALLLAGGLNALQVGAILIALPFSVVMLVMCVATWKQLAAERARQIRVQRRLEREKLTEQVSQHLLEGDEFTEQVSQHLLEGDDFTDQVSQSLIEEGWTEPNGAEPAGTASAGATRAGTTPAAATPSDTVEDKV